MSLNKGPESLLIRSLYSIQRWSGLKAAVFAMC
jgi:hypothetical protein